VATFAPTHEITKKTRQPINEFRIATVLNTTPPAWTLWIRPHQFYTPGLSAS
jgi:hypothetical protein